MENVSGTTGKRPRRRPGRMGALLGAVVALVVLATGCLGPITRLLAIEAVRFPETSDPSVVRVGDTYYIYGSNNHLRAPIFTTKDISRAYSLGEKNTTTKEGMPNPPAWAANPNQLWAPTVGQLAGRWVMFFATDRRNPPDPNNKQCIGRAWANSPAGPFVAEPNPWNCGLNGTGGALDPQLFSDPFGRHFLLAAFGNTESPIHSIPLDGNGNAAGAPVAILARQHGWE
ncbi:MAG: family 43 glycosylhydrolase, partial [Microthrixaceae bacterium]